MTTLQTPVWAEPSYEERVQTLLDNIEKARKQDERERIVKIIASVIGFVAIGSYLATLAC